ncbi:MAG: hypothetical protein ACI9UJ_001282, partial [bacterium]
GLQVHHERALLREARHRVRLRHLVVPQDHHNGREEEDNFLIIN